MKKIRKLSYLALVLSLVLALLVPAGMVMAQDEEFPCDYNFTDDEYYWGFTPFFDIDDCELAQTFTTHWDYNLSGIDLFMDGESNSAVMLDLSLCSYNGDEDDPVFNVLGGGTSSFFFDGTGPQWFLFDFDESIPLQACQEYAFVLEVVEYDGLNGVIWADDNQYTEGKYMEYCDNNGQEWDVIDPIDLMFALYGCSGSRDSCVPQTEPTPTQPSDTVGGDIFTVNKTALIAPWVALGVIFIAGGFVLYRRRAHGMK